MEPRCCLCGKTVKELAEEELEYLAYDRTSMNINLSDKLAFPYLLCDGCEELLRAVVPAILVAEGILKLNDKDEYTLAVK